jgi:hypothetical protein
MTPKSLHDHHTARFACDRAVREQDRSGDEAGSGCERHPMKPGCSSPTNSGSSWMKLVKTSAIVVAVSALLAGPALAQGTSSDKHRGSAKSTSQMQQGGMGEDAPATGAGQRAGAKTGAKGTVGAGSGAARPMGGAATPPAGSR